MAILVPHQPNFGIIGFTALLSAYQEANKRARAQEDLWKAEQAQRQADAIGQAIGQIGSAPFLAMTQQALDAREHQQALELLRERGRIRQDIEQTRMGLKEGLKTFEIGDGMAISPSEYRSQRRSFFETYVYPLYGQDPEKFSKYTAGKIGDIDRDFRNFIRQQYGLVPMGTAGAGEAAPAQKLELPDLGELDEMPGMNIPGVDPRLSFFAPELAAQFEQQFVETAHSDTQRKQYIQNANEISAVMQSPHFDEDQKRRIAAERTAENWRILTNPAKRIKQPAPPSIAQRIAGGEIIDDPKSGKVLTLDRRGEVKVSRYTPNPTIDEPPEERPGAIRQRGGGIYSKRADGSWEVLVPPESRADFDKAFLNYRREFYETNRRVPTREEVINHFFVQEQAWRALQKVRNRQEAIEKMEFDEVRNSLRGFMERVRGRIEAGGEPMSEAERMEYEALKQRYYELKAATESG